VDIHERSGCHVSNVARVLEFTKRAKDPTSHADVQLTQKTTSVAEHTGSCFETVKFTAIQNIALRGHRDDGRIEPDGCYPQTTMETSE